MQREKLSHSYSINLRAQFGHTALIIAAINDNQNITALLIAKEANTDLQDDVRIQTKVYTYFVSMI